MMVVVFKAQRTFQFLKRLDLALEHLSLNVEFQDLELSKGFDRLNFKVYICEGSNFIFGINLMDYLQNPQNPKSIDVYDSTKHAYVEVVPVDPSKELLFGIIKQLI